MCIGIDLLLTPGFRKQVVLEVNAFGDLLPGKLYQGIDAYRLQVREMFAREAK